MACRFIPLTSIAVKLHSERHADQRTNLALSAAIGREEEHRQGRSQWLKYPECRRRMIDLDVRRAGGEPRC